MIAGLDTTALVGSYTETLPNAGALKGDDARLHEQTDKFEALILKQMLDIAMKSGDTLFPKATGSKIYESMYHDTLSKELSGGFGYSELLFQFLTKNP